MRHPVVFPLMTDYMPRTYLYYLYEVGKYCISTTTCTVFYLRYLQYSINANTDIVVLHC